MNLAEECKLSYYKEITMLNEQHNVALVQHTVTGELFVRKTLDLFDIRVFQYLKDNPVKNTPLICEIIEDGKKLIVIEEYIKGVLLSDILEQQGTLNSARAGEIVMELCLILEDLHSAPNPIIHRDIKPSNIMISADNKVKLLDMNAAKSSSPDSTRDTNLIGTAGYAAPEQYGFGSSDEKTDIFAAGVLLNIMITGEYPPDKTADGIYGKIIRKCIMLDPEKRFTSAKELYDAIKTLQFPESNPRRYLPIGFRTLQPVRMIFAGIGYAFLILICLSVKIPAADERVIWANRITLFIMSFLIIMVSSNWFNIWKQFENRKMLKIILIILADFAIAFVSVVLMYEIIS